MSVATPPPWAERILLVLLEPPDRQSMSGDLLEEYRERIHPARGARRADLWYVGQVAWIAWYAHRRWASLLGFMLIARTTVDWLLPVTDFQARAAMLTTATAAILVCAGLRASWRFDSVGAGVIGGMTTALAAAVINAVGAATLLALSHGPATFDAIDASGGLAEVFTVPLMLVMPGALLGAFGGCLGRAARL